MADWGLFISFYVLSPRKHICCFCRSLDEWNYSRIRGYDRGRASKGT